MALAHWAKLAADTKDIATEVHVAELISAVRRADVAGVASWGGLCAKAGAIDRCGTGHRRGIGIFGLSATPLWFACYR